MKPDFLPLVTVLMPVFNGEKFLSQAIESILNQTYSNFELLIIDDGSTDNSIQIIESFHDSRIKLIKTPCRLGLSKSLNLGVRLAKGIYIARMDADDISYPLRFEEQITYLEKNKDCQVISSLIRHIDENGNPSGTWDIDKVGINSRVIDSILPWENCIAHPTIMIRQEILATHPYDEKTIGAEDYELWLRLRYYGVIIHKLPQILLDYRIHDQSISISSSEYRASYKKLLNARYSFLINIKDSPNFSTLPIKVIIAHIYDTMRFFITVCVKKVL